MGAIMRVTMKITAHTTPLEGALTSLYCATSPEAPAKGQGRYWLPVTQTTTKADKWLGDREGNKRLWEWSEGAVGKVE